MQSLAVCEAKWQDAPLTLDAERDETLSHEGDAGLSCIFVYSSRLQLEEIKIFYEQEMERLGWSPLSRFVFSENTLLVFEKPHKVAVIELHGQWFKTAVRLFVGMKKGREISRP